MQHSISCPVVHIFLLFFITLSLWFHLDLERHIWGQRLHVNHLLVNSFINGIYIHCSILSMVYRQYYINSKHKSVEVALQAQSEAAIMAPINKAHTTSYHWSNAGRFHLFSIPKWLWLTAVYLFAIKHNFTQYMLYLHVGIVSSTSETLNLTN